MDERAATSDPGRPVPSGPTPPAPAPASLTDGLARAAAALAAVLQVDVLAVPGQEAIDAVTAVEGLRRQAEALAGQVIAAVDAHGLWALDGARSLPAWYRARTGRADVTARAEIARTRALRDHLPATADALAAGRIRPDHAAALTLHALATPTLRERLEDPGTGEDFLLHHAQAMDATTFTKVVKAWVVRADPGAADHSYRDQGLREEVFLSRTADGWSLKGWLTEANGEVLATALAARTGTPAQTDRRTPAQRRAGALAGIARLSLVSGALRPAARIRPHIAVTVPFDTLRRLVNATDDGTGTCGLGAAGSAFFVDPPGGAGAACGCGVAGCGTVISTEYDTTAMRDAAPATLADGTALSHALPARLTCSSALHRIVFGPDGQPLGVGREERLYTTAQTRAILARDRHCQFPGCTAPPGEGEIHHSLWWYAQQGPTDTDKGVLLCWHHHDHVHQRRITITRHHGRWRFHRHDDTEITPPLITSPRERGDTTWPPILRGAAGIDRRYARQHPGNGGGGGVHVPREGGPEAGEGRRGRPCGRGREQGRQHHSAARPGQGRAPREAARARPAPPPRRPADRPEHRRLAARPHR